MADHGDERTARQQAGAQPATDRAASAQPASARAAGASGVAAPRPTAAARVGRPAARSCLTHDASAEDLGDDVRALAIVARASGRASVVRRVDGVLVRVTVEAA
jgi:hypothetical protein